MTVGWRVARLGDVCCFEKEQDIHVGLPYVGLENIESGTGRFLGATNAVSAKSATFRFSPAHVLYGRLRPYLNKVLLPDFEGHCSTEIFPIKPGHEVSREYLFHWLSMDSTVKSIDATATGARMPRANMSAVLDFEFPVPSLQEQQRIVSTLDVALEGIATAKANAEKNLQNARELFGSHLESLLAQCGDGWLEAPIAECFKVRSGDFLPAKGMVSEGDVPVYGGNGIAGSHDVSNLSGEQIVIGRVGAKCGNVRHVSGEIWLTDNALYISNYLRPFAPAFLARVLNLKNLRQTANQAAQPVISYTTIKDVVLSFPVDIEKQRELAARLDELEEHVEHVQAVYERKLTALVELKNSLMHQAFTGALTRKANDKQLEAVA